MMNLLPKQFLADMAFRNRVERQKRERGQVITAAAWGGLSIPIRVSLSNGTPGPVTHRAPVPLDIVLRPEVWSVLLDDAMKRSGKGFRKAQQGRVPPKGAAHWRGPRREDKSGTSKISRKLLLPAVQA